jgi:hypothetical protein
MKTAILALAAFGLAAAGSAEAGTINHREHRQSARIREGVQSGELTRRETRRLVGQQAHIRAEEYRYRHNDGELGPRERADLRHDENRASRSIYRQKHDEQSRP